MNAIDKNEEFSRQDRIKALIVRFGEKSSVPLRVNVEMLSKALSKDLEQYKDFIVDILFQW
ncbi:Nuclear cap-binding protein subunit 1 [Bonamia ostreae]|uniref:Nuclear cap-binding protein subunit 1 n=1 Tax=Bonamia ostreae TaxID=126728 RepID=A0ABV2AKL0_9EUKA